MSFSFQKIGTFLDSEMVTTASSEYVNKYHYYIQAKKSKGLKGNGYRYKKPKYSRQNLILTIFFYKLCTKTL